MSLSLYLAFCVYAIVTSVTPGPNNFLALASGVNFGVKKTWPLVLGICFGFTVMFLLIALGINALFIQFPIIIPILKVLGSLYILYLAYLIAGSGKFNVSDEQPEKMLGFWNGAFFQWINPKSWIVLLGAITAYTTADTATQEIIFIGLIYGVIAIPCVLVWAVIGDQMGNYLSQGNRAVIFNRVMGLLLAVSLIPIWTM
ncbi:threonine/homoserine/homoserine lactone efflux protein [Acinetobacter calcoaceticus]|uniref:Threonine/homoserine/homoserine lactone efflux protein n=1 Tax=Acinetobacter calcoaceticus TaxID=471 RepID=A0A4R1XSV8_ACICA|nr:threonine/homoserine/homoserine lactone efflux protein [Acinetobacter calcoaceticus]